MWWGRRPGGLGAPSTAPPPGGTLGTRRVARRMDLHCDVSSVLGAQAERQSGVGVSARTLGEQGPSTPSMQGLWLQMALEAPLRPEPMRALSAAQRDSWGTGASLGLCALQEGDLKPLTATRQPAPPGFQQLPANESDRIGGPSSSKKLPAAAWPGWTRPGQQCPLVAAVASAAAKGRPRPSLGGGPWAMTPSVGGQTCRSPRGWRLSCASVCPPSVSQALWPWRSLPLRPSCRGP